MNITFTEPRVFKFTTSDTINVIGYDIRFDLNHVLAAAGEPDGQIIADVIIDDLEGVDLSLDNLNTVFKAYLEENYPAV